MRKPICTPQSQEKAYNTTTTIRGAHIFKRGTKDNKDKNRKAGCVKVKENVQVYLVKIDRSKGELIFLECINNEKPFLALVDSGSQINVVSASVASDCNHTTVKGVEVLRISGVGGKLSPIIKWIELPLNLRNGSSVKIKAAVIQDKNDLFILGVPFLDGTGARIDFKTSTMDTCHGRVPLIRKQTGNANGYVVKLAQIEALDMPTLTPEERSIILGVLLDHVELFTEEKMGMCQLVKHNIRLSNDGAVVVRARPHSEEHRKAIKEQTAEMLAKAVIRPSYSSFAAEVVMVKKREGTWRFCVDYRMLNKVTIKDKYPLPRIPDLLRSIKDSKYFVTLDLRSGYWQIPMEEASAPLTAFRSPCGLYEFIVMPFGLTNAPATFQRAMDSLLGDMAEEGVSVYLDDILIHSKTFDGCTHLLKIVLARLQEAGLSIKIEKCKFFPRQLKYLGHVLEQGRILPDEERVACLRQIRPATSLVEMQRILGLFGYYQIFIPQYAALTRPLTDSLKGLTRPKMPITWTREMQEALNQLCEKLSHAVLTVPIEADEFLLETDASGIAVGGVLSVKRDGQWCPIEFTSKKFSECQLRWPVREKEAYAIIHALQKFDPFLRGRRFIVHTDHQSLKWLMDATTGKIARWASRLAEYDMDIYWKRGAELQHVDFFSRYIDEDPALQDRMCMAIKAETPSLPTIQDVLYLQQKEDKPSGKGYAMRGSVLCYRNGVWVPQILRKQIIAASHLLPPYFHCGVKKTKSTILKAFNWPNLHQDVTDYVRGCLACQRMRPGLERLQGLASTHPIPEPFETVYLDYWEGTHWGKPRIVVTMIDQSTKWVEAEEVETHSAENLSTTFLKHWMCRFGVPRTVVTDNGLSFSSLSFGRLLKSLGTIHLRTTPYHPQGNAPIETFHRQLNQKVPLFEKHHGSLPFTVALSLILWSYRATIHSTTEESPAYLLYGLDMCPPYTDDWRFSKTTIEEDRLKFLNNLRHEIQEKAMWKIVRQQAARNLKRLPKEVKEGDLVLTRLSNLERQKLGYREKSSLKFVPHWSLPCRVIKLLPKEHSYLVRSLLTGKTRQVHITDLRLIKEPQDTSQEDLWAQEAKYALRYIDYSHSDKRTEDFRQQIAAHTKRRRQDLEGGS